MPFFVLFVKIVQETQENFLTCKCNTLIHDLGNTSRVERNSSSHAYWNYETLIYTLAVLNGANRDHDRG